MFGNSISAKTYHDLQQCGSWTTFLARRSLKKLYSIRCIEDFRSRDFASCFSHDQMSPPSTPAQMDPNRLMQGPGFFYSDTTLWVRLWRVGRKVNLGFEPGQQQGLQGSKTAPLTSTPSLFSRWFLLRKNFSFASKDRTVHKLLADEDINRC